MRLSTTLAILLAFVPATHATESRDAAPATFTPDSIAGIPDDGAAAFTPDGASAPTGLTDELAPLDWFVGAWQCTGQFSNGRLIHSRETFSTEMDGHWLRMRHADTLPDRYAADEWWGYDRATRQFTVTVFDNGGGVRHYVSSGWSGTTLSLRNTATSGYIDRFMFQRGSDAQYRVSYAHLDGSRAWQPGDELTCRRDAEPPA